MASQTRTYEKKKLLGQVYTPFHIVDKILKDSGFYSTDLTGKQILDPACGDGRFLVPIANISLKTLHLEDFKPIRCKFMGGISTKRLLKYVSKIWTI
jgi:type I restriction-modification system DNA methylase subunit